MSEQSDRDFWRRVYRIAYSVATRRFRMPPADAEDVAQDLALRVLQRGSCDQNVSWMFQGAVFLCIDRLRARIAEERRHSALLSVETHRENTSEDYAWREAVSRLSPHCQKLIHLRFWEEKTWEEIDAIIGSGHRCSRYRTQQCLELLLQRCGLEKLEHPLHRAQATRGVRRRE